MGLQFNNWKCNELTTRKKYMKKLVTTILAVVGFTAYVNAQGSFIVDSGVNAANGSTPTSASNGRVFLSGVLDTATDINISILYGTDASSVTTLLDIASASGGNGGAYAGNLNWIATQPTGATDISFNGNGTLLDPNGNTLVVPTIGAGSTAFLLIEAWTGNAASYAAAQSTVGALFGQTGIFSLVLASTGTPVQPTTAIAGSLNLVTAVPEPSTMALAGLGGLAALLFRRKK